jgi:hypothetical protein
MLAGTSCNSGSDENFDDDDFFAGLDRTLYTVDEPCVDRAALLPITAGQHQAIISETVKVSVSPTCQRKWICF